MPESVRSESSRWIWPFEILERIGEGGMGQVYRARYVPRNIDVAVKMVPEDVKDGTTLARFEREMEVLKELRHPNIVRTFGGVCEDKQRFYAMELIAGGTLEDELKRRGRFTWEQVIQYGLQMCAALDYLHSKGVVHRDVKPSNFLKSSDGRLKLSDFGLASVVAERKITAEGRTAGTFLYMAPEQIRGGAIVPQTDLYALGCVFFELLTGKPPFIGETPAATLHKHCQQTPPRVTEFALDCPLALERIVAKLLEKSPEQRYPNAREVARDLSAVTQTVDVREPRRRELGGPVGNQLVQGRDHSDVAPTEAVVRTIPAAPLQPYRRYLDVAAVLVIALLCGWMLMLRSDVAVGRQARDLWVQATASQHDQVRIQAVMSLGQLAEPEGLAVVVDKLQSDSSPAVRAAAATALGNAGDNARPYIAKLLKRQKEDESQEVRTSIGQALLQLQDR